MNEDGTYSQLVEAAQEKMAPAPRPAAPVVKPQSSEQKTPARSPAEDINTTPHLSQNYRFTEQELHWLRKQSYDLTERFGTKISQNAVLRIALHFLRQATEKNKKDNPLLDGAAQLKK